jgi:hypothetical protein
LITNNKKIQKIIVFKLKSIIVKIFKVNNEIIKSSYYKDKSTMNKTKNERNYNNLIKEINSILSKTLLKIRVVSWDLLNKMSNNKVTYIENFELYKKIVISGKVSKPRFNISTYNFKNIKLFSFRKKIHNNNVEEKVVKKYKNNFQKLQENFRN